MPKQGIPRQAILSRLEKIIHTNKYQIPTGRPCARPITRVHPFASSVQGIFERTINPNICAPYLYDSVWEVVEDLESMLLHLCNHPDPQRGGSVVLKSGTQALAQALQLYLVHYYTSFGYDLRRDGLLGTRLSHIPEPIILSSLDANGALEKAVESLGLGRKAIYYYGLDSEYNTDYISLQETLNSIHQENKRIFANIIVAGDTERGKMQDAGIIGGMVADSCKKYGYTPPIVVDASAQWLNAAMLGGSEKWDFQNHNVRAIIVDPQKIELPYDLSVLLLADYGDLKVLVPESSASPMQESKRMLEAQANMLTSRGGSQMVALYAYLLEQGIEGLKTSRKRICSLAQQLARYITQSEHYVLVVRPETSVVAWQSTHASPEANWKTALAINNAKDGLCVAYSPIMRIRTVREHQDYVQNRERKYDGLHAHIMEHNTEDGIGYLCQRLEEVGEAMVHREG